MTNEACSDPPLPVGLLTDGEMALLRAWADDIARVRVAAERERCAKKPLTFDQLQSVMSQHFGAHELTDDEADSAEAFARAVERAHGIGA